MSMSYTIRVKTSDEGGAGTDSNIYLRLIGDQETSDEIRLNSLISGDAFERNDLDSAVITRENVGWVYKISEVTGCWQPHAR